MNILVDRDGTATRNTASRLFPIAHADRLPAQLEARIVAIEREKPDWGVRKIRGLLICRLPGDVRVPAKSTIHAALHREVFAGGFEGLAQEQESRGVTADG